MQVEVLSILKHPNIIAYFSNFVDEKSLMIVMEYAPGGTLFEFIQDRHGMLMEEEVVSMFGWTIVRGVCVFMCDCLLFGYLQYADLSLFGLFFMCFVCLFVTVCDCLFTFGYL